MMCNNQNVKNKIILIAHAVIIVSGIIYFVVSRSKECGYDGGDCDEFNAQYPDCTAKNTRKIGDGKCNNEYPYNTEECGYDGGDCIDFNAQYPWVVSQGVLRRMVVWMGLQFYFCSI